MRYLIVDGHSVIFAWPELRKLHDGRTGRARAELVKILTAYQDASGVRVVAVFDGKGEKMNEATEPGGIQIFYSGVGQTADDIVERLVAKYASQHEITVATSDFMEQQTVTTFGALVVSAEGLRAWLDDADRELRREIKKLKKKL
jgi:predicted RNA-binding protein with PIN domain